MSSFGLMVTPLALIESMTKHHRCVFTITNDDVPAGSARAHVLSICQSDTDDESLVLQLKFGRNAQLPPRWGHITEGIHDLSFALFPTGQLECIIPDSAIHLPRPSS